ncbi:polysaccharide deacetylase family protein [Bradyrhizobium sp. INPA01-394B]|uniref:Chitooligosaccharide deacetylase n=1 Tax=Bradyrhizobium campsiandrae TaxID=1729892 RepID=A0ABR7UHZ8_9BRAD|nr:polysaccharide deacetylase family protein [Bradyrhizobium campsiandrae]MBC9879688.1 polysaccharide deacetylase family protein [Bradyrhizobium campsiandrae]MBC9983705.1 polysaccharide deacetylase family protein [Bradyrhizobium campsiandrae]
MSQSRPNLFGPAAVLLIAMGIVAPLASANAAGPSQVAVHRRETWPDAIDSSGAFDRRSRAEELVFARALAESENLTVPELKAQLDVDVVDMPSVERVRRRLWRILAANYAIAIEGCGISGVFCPVNTEAQDLRNAALALSESSVDERYRPWLYDAIKFHKIYLRELLRLAALFPRVSSEIDVYNDRELQGWELADRQFVLTFDDGPSEVMGSGADTTIQLIEWLRRSGINGIFFVLGERMRARAQTTSVRTLDDLYAGMCVGSHGWSHYPHTTWPQWQESVVRSLALVGATVPNSRVALFRPPYGQRLPGSGVFFAAQNLKVVLWNIDSQDWQSGLTPAEIERRVFALMLLWRRGVILFHDTDAKARVVMVDLIKRPAVDFIKWLDCRRVAAETR